MRRIAIQFIMLSISYENELTNSGISYVAPADKLMGRDEEIFKQRDRKLEEARLQRKIKRQEAYEKSKSSQAYNSFLTPVT